MSVADCGWGMLFARNAQEAGDFCLIARRAAEAIATPFFSVQDGFLTTHTVEIGAAARAGVHEGVRRRPEGEADQPDGPGQPADVGRGAEPGLVHEGQDRPALVLRSGRAVLEESFEQFYRKTGRRYGFVEAYRCDDADYILVGMGCYMETAKATVDYLRDARASGRRLPDCLLSSGHSRPGKSSTALKDCRAFTVFERMDDPLSTTGNHLTREIKAAFCDALKGQNGQEKIEHIRASTAGRPAWAAATSAPAT